MFASLRGRMLAAPNCDNYGGMTVDTDILGNATWGDCADAATYREVEIMSFATTGKEQAATTDLALQLYTLTTGFNPNAGPSGMNPTDQGTNLQELLDYRLNTGIVLPDGSTSKLVAYFELDSRNHNDCRLAIEQGGVIQLGINAYPYFDNVQQGGTWNPPTAGEQPDGGHAICSGKYEPGAFIIKSWAMDIVMPIATWDAVVQEAYCIVSPEWLKATGTTPFGMSLTELDQAMAALKY
jgi:hypothetical protein